MKYLFMRAIPCSIAAFAALAIACEAPGTGDKADNNRKAPVASATTKPAISKKTGGVEWIGKLAGTVVADPTGVEEIEVTTGEAPWSGAVVGTIHSASAESPLLLPCEPSTEYSVSMDLRGVKDYDGQEMVIIVRDAAQKGLASSKFNLTADWAQQSVLFKTGADTKSFELIVSKMQDPEKKVGFSIRYLRWGKAK